MKLVFNRSQIVNALSMLERVSDRKSDRQVLSGVRVALKGEGVELSATDLEKHLKIMVPVDIEESGEPVVVDTRLFSQIAKKLPADKIRFNVNPSGVYVSGGGRYKMNVMAHEQFPELMPVEPEHIIHLPMAHLHKAIHKVGYAALQEDTRPFLQTIHIEVKAGVLHATATDSSRLATIEIEVGSDTGECEFLLPISASRDLLSMPTENVEIRVGRSSIEFLVKNIALMIRTIEGRFPNTSMILGRIEDGDLVKLSRRGLADVVDRALIGFRQAPVIRLESDGEGKLNIASYRPEDGEFEGDIEVEGNWPSAVHLNGSFIVDALRPMESDQISIRWDGQLNPLFVVPESGDKEVHIIMPVRAA